MKILSLLLFSFIIVVVTTLSTALIVNLNHSNQLVDVKAVYVKVIIDDYVGFDLSNETLNFGVVLSEGTSRKNMTVISQFPYDVFVDFDVTGNVSSKFRMPSGFVLHSYEKKELEFLVVAGEEDLNTMYDGSMNIYFLKE